ncbi:hypothetical protein ACHQM5_027064 [Ranunculus cassubicifolius]
MVSLRKALPLAIIIGAMVMANIVVSGIPNTNITTVLCNSGIFTMGDPFTASLAYVLDDLEAVTPSWKKYNYFNISPYPNAFAYGHGRCNTTLTGADCSSCLRAARKALLSSCPSRIGSRSVLYDCTIRYEQYPFTD